MWVGLIQSVEGLKRMKKLTLHKLQEISPAWLFDLGYMSFIAFRLELKHWLFLGCELASLGTGTIPSATVLYTHLADYRFRDSSASIIM